MPPGQANHDPRHIIPEAEWLSSPTSGHVAGYLPDPVEARGVSGFPCTHDSTAIMLSNSYLPRVAFPVFVAIYGASASDRCELSRTRHPARRSGPSKRPIPKRL